MSMERGIRGDKPDALSDGKRESPVGRRGQKQEGVETRA